MRMSIRALLAAASLVVIGAAAGIAGDRLWLAHHQPPERVLVDMGHVDRFRAMLDTLELSDSQRVAIDDIMGHYQGNVEQVWVGLEPRLQITMDSARNALHNVLDERQSAIFRDWLAAEHERLSHAQHSGFGH